MVPGRISSARGALAALPTPVEVVAAFFETEVEGQLASRWPLRMSPSSRASMTLRLVGDGDGDAGGLGSLWLVEQDSRMPSIWLSTP
jgi:hypothetical protein